MGGRELGIVEQLLHLLQAGEDFDQSRQVIQEGGRHHPATAMAQLQQLPIGPFRADALAQVEPGQGAHPVAAEVSFSHDARLDATAMATNPKNIFEAVFMISYDFVVSFIA